MSEAQIAKLESLLGRIARNRRPEPPPSSLGLAAPLQEPVEAARVEIEEEPVAPETPARASSPTPMEQALSAETETTPAEPELEILVDADEDDDDGPVITIEADPPEPPPEPPLALTEDAPTAPIGTRAPPTAPDPSVPARIAASPVRASSPVVRVVSQPAARTFGELLERTLALRPR